MPGTLTTVLLDFDGPGHRDQGQSLDGSSEGPMNAVTSYNAGKHECVCACENLGNVYISVLVCA